MLSGQQSGSSHQDVHPFCGFVETTGDALRLIQAAREGIIPRITRRLNDFERRSMIRSGAVFVFGVEESGMKRWTEGLAWSPSRMSGNFLIYREVTERTTVRSGSRRPYTSGAPLSDAGSQANDRETYKPNGLIKKTITVDIDGADYHLISYYTEEDIHSGRLQRPLCRQDIMAMDLTFELGRMKLSRNPLKFATGPDGKLRPAPDTYETGRGSDAGVASSNWRGRETGVVTTPPTPSSITPSYINSVPSSSRHATLPVSAVPSHSSIERGMGQPTSFSSHEFWSRSPSSTEPFYSAPEARNQTGPRYGLDHLEIQSYHGNHDLTSQGHSASCQPHSPSFSSPDAGLFYESREAHSASPPSPSAWSWSGSNSPPFHYPVSTPSAQQQSASTHFNEAEFSTSDQFATFQGYHGH